MLLIDGYNLLFSSRRGRVDFRDLHAERDRLLHLLKSFCRVSGRRAILIFDHTKGPPVYGAPVRQLFDEVEVRFTTEDVTADEEIIAMLRSTRDMTAFTVVTSDRAIVDVAEERRVKAVPSTIFARDMANTLRGNDQRGPQRLLSEPEVDFWMDQFGLSE